MLLLLRVLLLAIPLVNKVFALGRSIGYETLSYTTPEHPPFSDNPFDGGIGDTEKGGGAGGKNPGLGGRIDQAAFT